MHSLLTFSVSVAAYIVFVILSARFCGMNDRAMRLAGFIDRVSYPSKIEPEDKSAWPRARTKEEVPLAS